MKFSIYLNRCVFVMQWIFYSDCANGQADLNLPALGTHIRRYVSCSCGSFGSKANFEFSHALSLGDVRWSWGICEAKRERLWGSVHRLGLVCVCVCVWGGGGGGGGGEVTSYIWHSTRVPNGPFFKAASYILAPFFQQELYDWHHFSGFVYERPQFSNIPVYAYFSIRLLVLWVFS